MTFIITKELLTAASANHLSSFNRAIADHTTADNMGCDLEHAPYQVSDVIPLLAVRFADNSMYEDACAELPAGSYLINDIDEDMLMTPERISDFEQTLSNYAHDLYLPGSDLLVNVV